MEDKNMRKGNFSYGFFLALLAWLLSLLVIIGVIISLHQSPFLEGELWGMISWNGGISTVIWLPLALIAGNIAKKNGKDTVKPFIASSFLITTLIIGGCSGLLYR